MIVNRKICECCPRYDVDSDSLPPYEWWWCRVRPGVYPANSVIAGRKVPVNCGMKLEQMLVSQDVE